MDSNRAFARASNQVKVSVLVKSQTTRDTEKLLTDLGSGAARDLALQEVEKSWIPANVHMRICTRYIEVEGKHLCRCGHLKDEHDQTFLRTGAPGEEWNLAKHTRQVQTNAFGEIEFIGFSSKIGKYVRVADNESMETILQLMLEQWRLTSPNLLISVTGGAKNFRLSPRLEKVFGRGLMKAAQSTGAWIITGGTNAGVMKYVGKAAREASIASSKDRVHVIGIATWGIIQENQTLINEDGTGLWPAQYKAEGNIRFESPLDHNHSHFILVDNGTLHQFGKEIPFRGRLEHAISQRTTTGQDSSGVLIPIVQLVLEGGPGTLQTVYEAIVNDTPAVVVAGSGRCADILAWAYQNIKEEEIEITNLIGKKEKTKVVLIDDRYEEEVSAKLKNEWGEQDLNQRLQWVIECVRKPHLMSVYNIDSIGNSSKDIDLAILHALFKAKKYDKLDQLKLALSWNRVDVARSELFAGEAVWDSRDLSQVMYIAILEGKVDFVKLFLENGVVLKDFLSYKCLLSLYNYAPEKSLMMTLLEKAKSSKGFRFSFEDIGELMKDLVGDFYRPLYFQQKYSSLDPDYILDGQRSVLIRPTSKQTARRTAKVTDSAVLVNEQGSAPGGTTSQGTTEDQLYTAAARISSKHAMQESCFDDPARELFIWSVLMNRRDMAMVFWEETKESMAPALLASKILKAMANETDDTEVHENILVLASEFEELAVGVLDHCYLADEEKAQLLLIRELKSYGNSTSMLMAVEADNKAFISHSCCQNLLYKIWNGKMSSSTNSLEMWACILCPPLIFLLINYREDEITKDDRMAEQIEKKKIKNGRLANGDASGTEMSSLSRMPSSQSQRNSHSKKKLSRQNTVYSGMNHGVDITNSGKRLTWYQRIAFFYNAPVITFIHNCISYILFLLLFSYVLLVDFNDDVSVLECILIVWVFTLFAEELRQLFTVESSDFRQKVIRYILDPWNIVDVITITLFITGYILRFIPPQVCYDCNEAARVTLALDLMTFFFRILRICSVNKNLGPKLVMIGRMMVDLFSFIFILLVFVGAYGVAIQAIMYPNAVLDGELFLSIFRKAYFQMFGELFLEELEMTDGCTFDEALYLNNTLPRCPSNITIPPIMLSVYILFTNVLMFNLLIAMFSNTFNKVQEKSHQFWKYQMYFLVLEFYEYSPLAPPFNMFYLSFLVIYNCIRKCKGVPRLAGFKIRIPNESNNYTFNEIHENTDRYWKFLYYHLVQEYYEQPPLAPPLILIAHVFILVRACIRKQDSLLGGFIIPLKRSEKTESYWHFMRYFLVLEYYEHPPIAPPFIIIAHVYIVCRYCYHRCGGAAVGGFKMRFEDENDDKQIVLWENTKAEDYIRKAQYLDGETTENRVAYSKERIDTLAREFEDFSENGPKSGISPQLDDRLTYLETQMQHTTKALNFIMQSLIEKNMASSTIQPPELRDVDKEKLQEQQEKDKRLQQEKEHIEELMRKRNMLHFQSRISPYPGTSFVRFKVPDEKVLWADEFVGYDPMRYTSKEILDEPYYADVNLEDSKYTPETRPVLPFNQQDDECKVDRRSFFGEYEVINGIPRNPKGRTGMIGRGKLARWGVNKAGDPIVTRWKKDAGGNVVYKNSLKVLEFISVLRADNKHWSIPGHLIGPGELVSKSIVHILDDKVLGSLFADDVKTEAETKIKEFLKDGDLVFEGYADDPRNTDNAWIETTAINFHDDTGEIMDQIVFNAGVTELAVSWRSIADNENFHGSHHDLVKKVANMRNAYC